MNRIAIGMPGSVPVRDYAVQSFKAAGIYDSLVKGNKLVMADEFLSLLQRLSCGTIIRCSMFNVKKIPDHVILSTNINP